MEHSDLVALTAYMAEVGYSAKDLAYAVEKPWKHEGLLADAREVEYYERNDIAEGNVWPDEPSPFAKRVPAFAEIERIDRNRTLLDEMMRESDSDLAWRAFGRRDQLT